MRRYGEPIRKIRWQSLLLLETLLSSGAGAPIKTNSHSLRHFVLSAAFCRMMPKMNTIVKGGSKKIHPQIQ